jgi:hypothetical protein
MMYATPPLPDCELTRMTASQVLRVDRQVGHRPGVLVDRHPGRRRVLGEGVEALLDRVLVRTGEGGVDQVARVRVALVHRELVAVLDGPLDLVDVREVDHRVDALGEQVEPQRHQIDVSGALAVAEQAALDSVRAGQQPQLGGGHAGAPVVVRVQAEHQAVPPGQVPVHPLDRVGVDVRHRHLDGGGQVDDQLPVRGRVDHLDDLGADLQRVLQLRAGVRLGRVLVVDVGVRGVDLRVLLAEPRALGGDVRDAVAVQPEDHPPLERGGRVVEVHDGAPRAAQRLEGAVDQVLPALGQHLDRDVLGDQVLLDQLPDEVVVGLAGRGEADLDLLVAHLHQELEHPPLALRRHRVDQRLVAVAQVHRAPARRRLDVPGRPGAVRQVDPELLLVGLVAVVRHPAGALPGDRIGLSVGDGLSHDGVLPLKCGVSNRKVSARCRATVPGRCRWEVRMCWTARFDSATRCRPSGLVAATKEEVRLPHDQVTLRGETGSGKAGPDYGTGVTVVSAAAGAASPRRGVGLVGSLLRGESGLRGGGGAAAWSPAGAAPRGA